MHPSICLQSGLGRPHFGRNTYRLATVVHHLTTFPLPSHLPSTLVMASKLANCEPPGPLGYDEYWRVGDFELITSDGVCFRVSSTFLGCWSCVAADNPS